MAIRILRVAFNTPVNIGGGGRAFGSVGTEDGIDMLQSAAGVSFTARNKPGVTVFVPNTNVVSIAFEPDGAAPKDAKK